MVKKMEFGICLVCLLITGSVRNFGEGSLLTSSVVLTPSLAKDVKNHQEFFIEQITDFILLLEKKPEKETSFKEVMEPF